MRIEFKICFINLHNKLKGFNRVGQISLNSNFLMRTTGFGKLGLKMSVININ